jgi:Tfp pilus assembly protein PilF
MKQLIFIAALILSIPLAGSGQSLADNALVVKTRFLLSQLRYGDAAGIADSVLKTGSPALQWKEIQAEAALGEGDPSKAASILEPFVQPDDVDGLYLLARYYALAGNEIKACECLSGLLRSPAHYPERYIKKDPAFEGIAETREWTRLWQNDWYSETETELAEIIYLLSGNQTAEAAERLEVLAQAAPASAELNFLKGKILWLDGKKRLAEETFSEAIMNARKDRFLLNEMAVFFRSQDFSNLELQAINQLLLLDPTNPEYLIQRAILRMVGSGDPTADREIRVLDDLGIRNAELDYQAGIRLIEKDPGKADQLISRAIDQETLDARYYLSRGVLRCEQSRISEGLADLAMSLDINPRQPDLYLKRGEIRHAEGDQEGACYDWRKALEMGSTRAADLLARYCR